jgi:hypothetical protein
MFIPDPDFYPFRTSDPKTVTKERGEKKIVFIPLYVATNFTNLKIIFLFEMLKKKFGPVFKELLNFLPQKFVTNLSKILV